MKKGIIKGTRKAGENAVVIVDGDVTVTWDSGETVKFVSENAFEAWAGTGKWGSGNLYIESIKWDN